MASKEICSQRQYGHKVMTDYMVKVELECQLICRELLNSVAIVGLSGQCHQLVVGAVVVDVFGVE